MDYFNAKDPLRTPRPRDFGELRPRTEKHGEPALHTQTQESSAFAITEEPRASSSATAPDFETSVRRRRSMPTFRYTSDPPPYPSFHPRGPVPGFVILPREEEGCERLPAYANAIYLCAIMPRKVEFLQPGVQARDRKWRRVLCVLEGTAFRVYKCPPGAAGVSALEEWWERKVGVGDITSAQSAVTATGIAEERQESVPVPPASPPPQEEPVPPPVQPSRSRFHLPAGLLLSSRSSTSSRLTLSTGNSRSRLNADSQRDDTRQAPASIGTRQSSDTSNSSRSSGNTTLTTPTTTTASSPTTSTLFSTNDGASVFSRHRLAHANSNANANANKPAPPRPDAKDLMRAYTLQNAESGLASDYTKRKNVVRVRMEGEQFLLQAQDVAAVIDWIEGIQAATAVAPDLDERPMPKGPIFPRRGGGDPDASRSSTS
ncbi:hypothetical protein A0H81_12603 [Grifola frondosa]|uniref:PH domain-containing protein n=1 Tax=Grifola frondosa TaxID=5627 RepID=A0A1C7LU43_GRIFR|nr:hypothetical protein A0H81_12603 [Grifola frondosa]